jgi:hypothetical protein
VGEQPGLVDHQLAHGGEVVDGGGVAVLGEPLGGDGVPLLGPLAEGEQRLVASDLGARRAMASTCSGVRYGASRRAGGWANVQYPHLSWHSIVSGMNTLGE